MHEARIVHYALELIYRFEKSTRRIPVNFLGDDMTPAKGREVRLHTCMLFGRLRKVEVAGMIEERALVEVTLVAAREETRLTVAGRYCSRMNQSCFSTTL